MEIVFDEMEVLVGCVSVAVDTISVHTASFIPLRLTFSRTATNSSLSNGEVGARVMLVCSQRGAVWGTFDGVTHVGSRERGVGGWMCWLVGLSQDKVCYWKINFQVNAGRLPAMELTV